MSLVASFEPSLVVNLARVWFPEPRVPDHIPVVETSWAVLTGGPCSGKTTLLQALADYGIKTSSETAREYFEEQLNRGLTIEEVRADPKRVQSEILKRSIEKTQQEDPNEVVIYDRGLPDSIAYQRLQGLDTSHSSRVARSIRYGKVFFLESIGVEEDGVRTESVEEGRKIEQSIKAVYRSLGYAIVEVPFMPVEERLELVLKELGLTESWGL